MTGGAGGDAGDVDLGVGDAGRLQHVAVRGPQVEEPVPAAAVTGVGTEEGAVDLARRGRPGGAGGGGGRGGGGGGVGGGVAGGGQDAAAGPKDWVTAWWTSGPTW